MMQQWLRHSNLPFNTVFARKLSDAPSRPPWRPRRSLAGLPGLPGEVRGAAAEARQRVTQLGHLARGGAQVGRALTRWTMGDVEGTLHLPSRRGDNVVS